MNASIFQVDVYDNPILPFLLYNPLTDFHSHITFNEVNIHSFVFQLIKVLSLYYCLIHLFT